MANATQSDRNETKLAVMAKDIDNIKTDLKDIKQNIRDLTDLLVKSYESRIRIIEDDHNFIGGTRNAYQRLTVIEKEWNDFKVRWKTIIAISVAVSSVITFILSTLLGITNLVR